MCAGGRLKAHLPHASPCDSLDEDLSKVIEALSKWVEKAKAPEAVKRGLELASGGAGQFASFAVNAEAITVFRELADSSEVATYGSDLAEQLKAIITSIGNFHKSSVFACDRLEDINSSYTLYRDLVITNKVGCVIGNANRDQRERVLGMNISQEHWFTKALETHDGTQYHAQDLASSVVESDQLSLIYSTAIRTGGETNGDIIGAMGIYFDFQGEVNLILHDYLPQDDRGNPDDGWYSFLTNEQGVVIGSSDVAMVPMMDYAHIPRRHRSLDQGERVHSYGVFEGNDAAVFSAKTDGYLEYEGLGWSSHFVLPKAEIFSSASAEENDLLSVDELMQSNLIPEINKETYIKVQDDKESIQLISLNGIVFASKLGKRGVALGPIFDQITKTGDFATSMMEKLLSEMAVGELQLNLQNLANSSKQAIDLIDRNLFERSADIRWWATDKPFWEALAAQSAEAYDDASARLKVINGSYTMYRNLVLADHNGDIVACSKLELRNELRKINVSDQEWFHQGCAPPKAPTMPCKMCRIQIWNVLKIAR